MTALYFTTEASVFSAFAAICALILAAELFLWQMAASNTQRCTCENESEGYSVKCRIGIFLCNSFCKIPDFFIHFKDMI